MKSFRLAINYNGRWDNLDYVDGQLIGELVENKLSYNELVEKTYILTGIDSNIYNIILYGVIKLRSRWTKYLVKRDNDIDFVFSDDSSIKEIYVDMEKRVDGSGGGDGHVHKLPPSFFKYDNVGCYTTDSDTEDEKPNEHDYPSSPDDTFVRVEQVLVLRMILEELGIVVVLEGLLLVVHHMILFLQLRHAGSSLVQVGILLSPHLQPLIHKRDLYLWDKFFRISINLRPSWDFMLCRRGLILELGVRQNIDSRPAVRI